MHDHYFVYQLPQLGRFTCATLPVREWQISFAPDAKRESAAGKIGELELAIGVRARVARLAFELRRRQRHARTTQRLAGVGSHDPSANDGAALFSARSSVARRLLCSGSCD